MACKMNEITMPPEWGYKWITMIELSDNEG
jgi:hypothetical protein